MNDLYIVPTVLGVLCFIVLMISCFVNRMWIVNLAFFIWLSAIVIGVGIAEVTGQ